MPRPFLVPKVAIQKIKGVSLEALARKLTGGPTYVRVGLPDSEEHQETE